MRKKVSVMSILAGIGVSAAGFFLAMPRGTTANPGFDNTPILPLAPVLFILGIMLMFFSAVIYELLPDKKR